MMQLVFLQCYWLLFSHSEVSGCTPQMPKIRGYEEHFLLALLAGCTRPTFKNVAPPPWFICIYLGRLSHFPSCFGAGVTNKWVFTPSPLLWVRSWAIRLHHCEQKAMRDEGVIYVAGHPLL